MDRSISKQRNSKQPAEIQTAEAPKPRNLRANDRLQILKPRGFEVLTISICTVWTFAILPFLLSWPRVTRRFLLNKMSAGGSLISRPFHSRASAQGLYGSQIMDYISSDDSESMRIEAFLREWSAIRCNPYKPCYRQVLFCQSYQQYKCHLQVEDDELYSHMKINVCYFC